MGPVSLVRGHIHIQKNGSAVLVPRLSALPRQLNKIVRLRHDGSAV